MVNAKILNCLYCGSEFLQRTANNKYCSSECCEKANLEKTRKDRYIIFERDGFRCFYCGRTSYEHNVVLHADHVIPKDLGGEDIAGNLVTACQECNVSKINKPISDIDPILSEVERRNLKHGILQRQPIKFSSV